MEQINYSDLVEDFPFFADIWYKQPADHWIPKKIPKGMKVFEEGDLCMSVPFVIKGTIRVSKIAENGREVTLYRMNSGDSCILTIASVLSHKEYPATAIAEEDTEVITIPNSWFHQLMTQSTQLQQYIYSLLSTRLIEILMLIDDIIFRKIDVRLMRFLLRKTINDGDIIEITHDQIAAELGTAREVVSRFMKGLEREQVLRLGRGRIKVINRERLEEKVAII